MYHPYIVALCIVGEAVGLGAYALACSDSVRRWAAVPASLLMMSAATELYLIGRDATYYVTAYLTQASKTQR